MIAKRHGKEPDAWLFKGDTVRYIAARLKAAGNSGSALELNEINDLPDSPTNRSKLLRLVKESGFVRIKGGSPVRLCRARIASDDYTSSVCAVRPDYKIRSHR